MYREYDCELINRESTTQLRKRTADEKTALVMILNHAIEVPTVPPFLRLSMTPGELAVFEDMFMALEYSLYAHLEPGQRCYDTWTPAAVLEQVTGGPEAAASHVLKIEEFKSDLSRISLDTTTRMVKVSFKGRAKAVKWVGWQMPLSTRMLPLIDYETIRTRSKRTHELVMMDYYSFKIEARNGEMSSRGMYELLTKDLGMQVQELEHIASPMTGIIEKQWQALVRSAGCPAVIRGKSCVLKGSMEVVLHHAAIHVNWPCRKCRSPEHPTRYCTETEDTIEAVRTAATCRLEREVQTERALKDRGRGRDAHTQALAKMEAMLRNEGSGSTRETTPAPAQSSPSRRREGATTPVGKAVLEDGPVETCEKQCDEEKLASVEAERKDSTEKPMVNQVNEDVEEEGSQHAPPTEPTKSQPETAILESGQLKSKEGDDISREATLSAVEHEFGSGEVDLDMTDMERTLPVQFAEAVKAVKPSQREEAVTKTAKARGRSPQRNMKGRGGSRSPTRHGGGTRSLNFAREMESREANKRAELKRPETFDGDNNEDEHAERRVSLSPKRRADYKWAAGRTEEEGHERGHETPLVDVHTKTRSLSPKRRSKGTDQSGGKITMQKFMHEFMTAITGKTDEDMERMEVEVQAANSECQAPRMESVAGGSELEPKCPIAQSVWTAEVEEQGFAVTMVTTPTDQGAPLTEWLAVLGGREVVVAANGHCGWLAFYAALYNKAEGVEGPSAEVVPYANLLKKRVLNEMLTGLADEALLHPEDLRAEAEACGYAGDVATSDTERIRVVANHLAEQRAKSVRATVTQRYWVRPMHLKAMACHARETIYVLDVYETETARLQAYAYHEVKDAAGEMVETGTVCPVPTSHAMALMKDFVSAGITPPVMILRWGHAGNHFQAVQYEPGVHDAYAKNIAVLAVVRNRILADHGWQPMDSIEYDPAKTAKAAAAALTSFRRQTRAPQAASGGSGSASRERAVDASGGTEGPSAPSQTDRQVDSARRECITNLDGEERSVPKSGGGHAQHRELETSTNTESERQQEAGIEAREEETAQRAVGDRC